MINRHKRRRTRRDPIRDRASTLQIKYCAPNKREIRRRKMNVAPNKRTREWNVPFVFQYNSAEKKILKNEKNIKMIFCLLLAIAISKKNFFKKIKIISLLK